jgi:hypothetical protein
VSLDDASYPLLWQLSEATHTPPEYFVAVMWSESSLNPAQKNAAGADYYGLNQHKGHRVRPTGYDGSLESLGIDPADYLTWSASQQLSRVVVGDFKGYYAALKNPPGGFSGPGVLYAMNFLSGRVMQNGQAPDSVLAASGEAPDPRWNGQNVTWYDQNKGLDFNNDGVITVGDLDMHMCQKVLNQSDYQAVVKRLYADPSAPSGATPADMTAYCTQAAKQGGGSMWKWLLGAAVIGGLGYAAWKYRMPLKRYARQLIP